MRIHCMIMATALVLALSGIAQAGTMYTPATYPETGSTIGCLAVNVGKKTIEVTFEVLDGSGSVNNDWIVSVLPGHMQVVNGDEAARY